MPKARRDVPTGARSNSAVRALLVSDVRLYREALSHWLERQHAVRIVGAAGSRDAALTQALQQRPDIVLIDMRMPDGVDVAHALADVQADLKLVGFALAETEDTVLAYAGAGFAGYVPPDTPLEGLLEVLEGIARGQVRYSRRITTTLLQRLAGVPSHASADHARLTPREIEILRLIDEGLSNREIARRLSIEPATVKNHVHNLLEKLQVNRRGEAAAMLRRSKLPLPESMDQEV